MLLCTKWPDPMQPVNMRMHEKLESTSCMGRTPADRLATIAHNTSCMQQSVCILSKQSGFSRTWCVVKATLGLNFRLWQVDMLTPSSCKSPPQQNRKDKTMLLSVIEEKLMVDLSVPLAQANIKRGRGDGGVYNSTCMHGKLSTCGCPWSFWSCGGPGAKEGGPGLQMLLALTAGCDCLQSSSCCQSATSAQPVNPGEFSCESRILGFKSRKVME